MIEAVGGIHLGADNSNSGTSINGARLMEDSTVIVEFKIKPLEGVDIPSIVLDMLGKYAVYSHLSHLSDGFNEVKYRATFLPIGCEGGTISRIRDVLQDNVEYGEMNVIKWRMFI